jgi:pimeloyl-ACP methyl ester carboxylesterase
MTGSGASAQSIEITADGPGGRLAGTLERAEAPRATALILPGSGPTDRNGNNPFGLNTDTYRLLAEALAAMGITTARIDKRGLGGSAGDPNAVSLDAYRADTRAWLDALDAPAGVWVIGHSEGALLALDAHALPGVCGVILLTPPGRPLAAVMRDQIGAGPLGGFLLPSYDMAMQGLMAGKAPDLSTMPPALAALFSPLTRDYMTELAVHDPATTLAEVAVPALIIHGAADIQVPPSEARPLTTARPDLPAHVLADMPHMLKATPQGADPNLSYTDPDLPLHPELVPLIAEFILPPR